VARRRTSRRDCKLEVVKLVTRRAWLQLGQPVTWMFTTTCCASGLVWAAAGSVDTDLSFLSSLELYGTEIAERRMPARRVVEALDVIEHV